MQILNFGSLNVDYVYSLDHIVMGGETISSKELNIFPGGKGLNQSVALARAGAQVYHAGCVGLDGQLLIDTLSGDGVDLTYLKTVDEKSGHAIIQVSADGENSIVLYAGANHKISCEQVAYEHVSCVSTVSNLLCRKIDLVLLVAYNTAKLEVAVLHTWSISKLNSLCYS